MDRMSLPCVLHSPICTKKVKQSEVSITYAFNLHKRSKDRNSHIRKFSILTDKTLYSLGKGTA